MKDFLIVNGSIFDPAAGTFAQGKSYRQVIDASDCIVTPGMIDYHVRDCGKGRSQKHSTCYGLLSAPRRTCGYAEARKNV